MMEGRLKRKYGIQAKETDNQKEAGQVEITGNFEVPGLDEFVLK